MLICFRADKYKLGDGMRSPGLHALLEFLRQHESDQSTSPKISPVSSTQQGAGTSSLERGWAGGVRRFGQACSMEW